MKRGKIYFILNIIIICCAIYFLYSNFFIEDSYSNNISKLNTKTIILLIIGIISVQFLKGIRFYLITLENRIFLIRYIRVFLKTMFINLTLPFKLGEFFRAYCFGKEMNSYKQGILSVIVDRYFDTIPVLFIILGYCLFKDQRLSLLIIVMTAFIVFITTIYLIFMPSYKYINRFLITNIHSTKSLKCLKILEKSYYSYKYINELIKDRFSLLLFLSFFTWGIEYFVLMFVSYNANNIFSNRIFIDYLNRAFTNQYDNISSIYIGTTTLVFTLLFIITYGISVITGGKNE